MRGRVVVVVSSRIVSCPVCCFSVSNRRARSESTFTPVVHCKCPRDPCIRARRVNLLLPLQTDRTHSEGCSPFLLLLLASPHFRPAPPVVRGLPILCNHSVFRRWRRRDAGCEGGARSVAPSQAPVALSTAAEPAALGRPPPPPQPPGSTTSTTSSSTTSSTHSLCQLEINRPAPRGCAVFPRSGGSSSSGSRR